MKTYKLNNVEIPESEIKALIKANPELLEEKKEVFKYGDSYWYLTSMNDILNAMSYWEDEEYDNYLINTNNAFKTIEEAEAQQKINYAIARINKYIRENDCKIKDVDWKDDDKKKYHIYYDNDKEDFSYDFTISLNKKYLFGELTEDGADAVYNNCLEDLKIVWGVK